MQPHAQELFFNLFYTFVCIKKFSSYPLKFPGKNSRKIYGKSKQASGEI